ncbi:hypothetical protein HYALB_00008752 [Hymenoscyphus albidus]|uniref:Uncharacterized protein n=1 Tax=Hymenoscyphus albidus TaxID=595503 RepID=A0A9N9LD76_9HELO|nr:hypothetical protein HYALB_00008752 [Hymenoscyphus albidus]
MKASYNLYPERQKRTWGWTNCDFVKTSKGKGKKAQQPVVKEKPESRNKVARITPRSPHDKLLHRLYEPLILLEVLDKYGGLPVSEFPSEVDATSNLELRRPFLNQLAYVCDFKKGGDTVTAEENTRVLQQKVAAVFETVLIGSKSFQ